MTLADLARWCRDNVPDGRISMCRVEPTCSPCPKLCGDCLAVEKRAKKKLAEEESQAAET